MLLFRALSAAACSAVNGGAMTISTSATSVTRPRSSFMYLAVSATVLNIFQLPAMKEVLISFVRQRGHPRQCTAAKELQRRAAAGGDMRDAIGDARFLHGCNRVAAADDRRPLHTGDCLRHRNSPLGERVNLKNAHRAVPDDHARIAQRVRVRLRRPRADVHA